MSRKIASCSLVLFLVAGLATPVLADSLKEAVTKGKVDIDIRYRFEYVDQDGPPIITNEAKASTVRTRLGYTTGKFRSFFAHIDMEDIRVVGNEQYNSTENGKTQYPVVADPGDTELNQGFLAYSAPKDTTLKLGRQRIKLDNDRFIGNVGWRQNEQTYDAFSTVTKPVDKLRVFYSYVNNVNRILGDHHPTLANIDMDSHLLNVAYDFPVGKLVGYWYRLEFESAPMASHQDIGVRFTGSRKVSDKVKILYAGEYAEQSDIEDGASFIDAEYHLVELGVGIKKIVAKIGYEVLGGDGTYAFQTPLATLHAFQGWTDRFLLTPVDGIEDLYCSLATTVKGFKLLGVYHDFSADNGGADYGTEIGLLVSRKLTDLTSFLVKYANYDADTHANDTEILWAAWTLKF